MGYCDLSLAWCQAPPANGDTQLPHPSDVGGKKWVTSDTIVCVVYWIQCKNCMSKNTYWHQQCIVVWNRVCQENESD